MKVKVCNHEHPAERCLRMIENILHSRGYWLQVGHDTGLVLVHKETGKVYRISDLEGSGQTTNLPREIDTERLIVEEYDE